MATMKQIAQLAGVSRGTVDRVLNKRGVVNKKTEQKVLEIANFLQYKPSKAARGLAALKRNIRFTYILFDPNINPFFQQVEAGIKKKAAELQEYDVAVDIFYSSFNDPENQNVLLDKALDSGTSGIVIAGHSTEETAFKLKKIRNMGIPVITANTDITDSGRIAYVGSDYYKSGETAAGILSLITKGVANVGVLIGSYNVLCHTQRVAGFTKHLDEYAPNIKILKICENSDEDFESHNITKDLLSNNPNIDALFLASAGVFGACRAVESLNLKKPPIIVSNDCTENTCQMLKKGIISATISQQPEWQGSKPLDLLFNLVVMGIQPKHENYFTQIGIVIKENL